MCSINLRCHADTTKESQTVHAEVENTLSATQSAVLNSKMSGRYDKKNQRTHGEVRPCHLLHRCAALNSRCQADTARRIKPLTVKTMETSGVRCSTWMYDRTAGRLLSRAATKIVLQQPRFVCNEEPAFWHQITFMQIPQVTLQRFRP